MDERGKESILQELNILKPIAMLLVGLGKSTVIYTGASTFKPSTNSTFFSVVIRYIYSFNVALFTFISGAIYCYCRKGRGKYNLFIKLINEKFGRLMMLFF